MYCSFQCIKRTVRRTVWLLFSIVLFGAVGCGGGGGAANGLGGSTGGGGNNSTPAATSTATFHVDVTTHKVTITPHNSPLLGKAFRGTTIGFQTSLLLDQQGNVGRKALQVQMLNNSGENVTGSPIVLFSKFTNVAAFSDIRPKTVVSTFAGTGAVGSADTVPSSSTFNHPVGVAVLTNVGMFVADFANNKIRKISNGIVSTLAGSGSAGELDGVGPKASFNGPNAICAGSLLQVQGLYVADATGNKIRFVSSTGQVSTIAGTGTAGSADGSGSTATFTHPNGLAWDGNRLYVSENSNKIRVVVPGFDGTPATTSVNTLAGSGAPGSNDGTGTAASFASPGGLTLNGDGINVPFTLIVADTGSNKIRQVTLPNGLVSTLAGTGTASTTNGFGDVATFNAPTGVASINGTLFITEGTGRVVRQMALQPGGSPGTPHSWAVATLAGTGVSGIANGTGDVATFGLPAGITADNRGNLFVADSNGYMIREVRPSTGFFPIGVATGSAPTEQVQLFNPDGVIPSSGYGTNLPFKRQQFYQGFGGGTLWQFVVPAGVGAFEFSVTVVADTQVGAPPEAGTNQGSPNVDVMTYAGAALGTADGTYAEARLGRVTALAPDGMGNTFFVDATSNAVRVVGCDGFVHTIAGGVGAGMVNGNGLVAKFSSPSGIAVTLASSPNPGTYNVYVADTGNHVVRVVQFSPTPGTNGFAGPVEWDAAKWTVSTVAGTAGTAGKNDGTGDVATFNAPFGMCVSGGGNLFVGEKLGNRIRRVQLRGGDATVAANYVVKTVAGDVSAVAGLAGTTDGTGIAARFSAPLGIAADLAGNVLVADSLNNRVRKVTPDGVTTTVAGSTAGYNDALGTAAMFNVPSGIAVDPSGYAYVTDFTTCHIRRISPEGDVKTVAGTGAAGTVNGAGNTATFNGPFGIMVDPVGSLYVTDYNTGTLRYVERVISGL